jgi:hypothetical protein
MLYLKWTKMYSTGNMFTCVIFEDLAEIIDSAASVAAAHIFSFFIVLLHP